MRSSRATIVASSGSEGGSAFATALGATAFQRTVYSALAAAEADTEKLTLIARSAPAGYELVAWDGLVPAPVAAEFVELFQFLRTAPNGEDIPMPASIEEQAEFARSFDRNGLQWWTAAARHLATGKLAAMTDLQVRPDGTASVLHTVTRPDHRRLGLARWLKASLLARFFDDPDAQVVITQNAEANAAAISVNRGLGMRQTGTVTGWRLRSDTG
jgi:RimJ/RimL family protein N-acetyltransferase